MSRNGSWQTYKPPKPDFRAMFENAGVGIALVGVDRRPLAVNDGMVRISGRTRDELLGTTGAIISHPDDIDIGKIELEKLLTGQLEFVPSGTALSSQRQPSLLGQADDFSRTQSIWSIDVHDRAGGRY